jgi:CDP-glucose 4,6-dehydratase
MGAELTGLSASVPTVPSLYELARVGDGLTQVEADVREFEAVAHAVAEARPEVVIHMAAQSLVRRSFSDPRGTYETNVMGTVNVLEAVRVGGGARVVVNVTSDKCYDNRMRGALAGAPILIRNPEAVRPWQHVLNPLSGYLVLAQALWNAPELADGWNFGPADEDARPVRWIADRLSQLWPDELDWRVDDDRHPHEARYLKLDSSRARARLRWTPRWHLGQALEAIVQWYRALRENADMREVTVGQIDAFMG